GVLAGVVLFQGLSSSELRGVGQLVLAVSFILIGVDWVGALVAPLAGSTDLRAIIEIATTYPWLAAALAALIASVVQSSTATLAVFIGFALHDGEIVSAPLIVEVIVGANLGITFLALATSWSDLEAKRFTLATLGCRSVVGVAALAWLDASSSAVQAFPGTLAQQAAIAHSTFNGAALVCTLIASPALAIVMPRLVAAGPPTDEIRPAPIDRRWADEPGIAFSQTKREISLAVRVTASMLRDAWQALETRDERLLARVRERDDTVDLVERHVKGFLTGQLTNELDSRDVGRRLLQLRFIGDLETIADAIDRQICGAARKIAKRGLWFNDDEWTELSAAFDLTIETIELAGAVCAEERRSLAEQLLERKDRVRDLELEQRARHYTRLQDGDRHSAETTDLYVGLLVELKHIAHLAAGVGHSVLDLTPRRAPNPKREPPPIDPAAAPSRA
ncbi:MAG: PhoU domain-containing protein, partial [Planctomycetota bacterium]